MTTEQIAFVKSLYPPAKESEEKTGVPALFKMAQCCIESQYGKRAEGYNYFGIKADPRWKGAKQLITTTEIHTTPNVKYPEILSVTKRKDGKFLYKVKDYFRKYNSIQESFDDHSKFLIDNPRYKDAFKEKDPIEFAKAVSAAGYATSPVYATLLEAVIKQFTPLVK